MIVRATFEARAKSPCLNPTTVRPLSLFWHRDLSYRVDETLLDKIEQLQNQLIGQATSGGADNSTYVRLRRELLADPAVGPRLPRYVRTCLDLSQFWQFIKYKFSTYQERREFIWSAFRPVIDQLSGLEGSPADPSISELLAQFDHEHVAAAWTKALERRSSDPEGAITAARTLLETVCKHILDDRKVVYASDADLPKLYRLTAEQLNLAPSQHSEHIFRQILGGCTSVVEGLGAMRNRLSDAHGHGRQPIKPAARHAELAVNLSGSVAVFLVTTYEARRAR
jgi:abortive infection Abi-like protein